ncbi:MAG: DTW domain-containing protein YfiP [Myxococcota bacterium]|jgi:DTW domain-containing protein YfiP
MCLCAALSPIDNRVHIHVLQHPRERRHALNTARLLRLGLVSCDVHVLSSQAQSVACVPLQLTPRAGLLYPATDSRELSELTAAERPSELVVIDGTWAQANRIYRDNPWLAALPSYRLSPKEGSRYRIRVEPRLECLSTVESVVAALRQLEPGLEGLERLDDGFDSMIDAQIAAATANPSSHARGQRPRRRVPKPVPAALLSADTCVIIAYAEAEPLRPSHEATSRAPIRLSAVTDSGDQCFDTFVRSHHTPSAFEAKLMGLSAGDFTVAKSPDAAAAAFATFCATAAQGRPLVLVSWGLRTLRWLDAWRSDAGCSATTVHLKAVWANVNKERVDDLEVVVSELGLSAADIALKGRSGTRLACARLMLERVRTAVGHG